VDVPGNRCSIDFYRQIGQVTFIFTYHPRLTMTGSATSPRAFGADISNCPQDDALALHKHAPVRLNAVLAPPNLVSSGMNPWAAVEELQRLKGLAYRNNMKVLKARKQLRAQGPPALMPIGCSLNPFADMERRENELAHYDSSSCHSVSCRNTNCRAMVSVLGKGWCKPCCKKFDRKNGHRQRCKNKACNEVIAAKDQLKGAKQWCKGCRVRHTLGAPPSPKSAKKQLKKQSAESNNACAPS
jgi:hypothetical protein